MDLVDDEWAGIYRHPDPGGFRCSYSACMARPEVGSERHMVGTRSFNCCALDELADEAERRASSCLPRCKSGFVSRRIASVSLCQWRGVALCRIQSIPRSIFPIFLLLFLNPAPVFLINLVDLPLQYVGAHTASAFAQWIGVPLAVDDLRLMFSPALGMFIAPGCNGLRGALRDGLPDSDRRISLPSSAMASRSLLSVGCGAGLSAEPGETLRAGSLLWVAVNFKPLARHMEAADYALGSLIFYFCCDLSICTSEKMARSQQATRKLVAFTAVAVLCAGVPHFLLDRRSLPHHESHLLRKTIRRKHSFRR